METSLDKPIYLDYMATTPVDPRVIAKMLLYLGPDGDFGNPASQTHIYGQRAAEAVFKAREQIANSISATSEDLIFTSGATEANNLAILGAMRFYQRPNRKHAITMTTEHKAVLDVFKQLEKEGFNVTYLDPESDGLLNLNKLAQSIKPETILVSIMHVNNEIGVVQDLAAIGEFLTSRGILFHVDAAQSAGKLPIDLSALPVHLMSFSAHKNYGPKGVGALFVRHKPRIRLQPLFFGGGHEGGLRSGTLPTHQIVGMGEAFALAESSRIEEQARILKLRKKLWDGIKDLPNTSLNGNEEIRVAGNLNITFAGIPGEELFLALRSLAISSTSACVASSQQTSYVLKAIGLSDMLAASSIRIACGRFTTEAEIDKTIKIIRQAIHSFKVRK